jgi:phosphoglycerate dehydrogenase-like enzyme
MIRKTGAAGSRNLRRVVASSLMDKLVVLLVENPSEPPAPLLGRMPDYVELIRGVEASDFRGVEPRADIIFSWGAKRSVMEKLLPGAARLKWIHSRSAGLDGLLFPALIESPVPLTNGRGVFSQSLGEFVIGAVLFFAKDFRRMLRSQRAGQWDQFDTTQVEGQTLGIVGYGDIGRAIAKRAKALEMNVLALRRRPELSAGDGDVTRVYGYGQKMEMIAQCDYVVAAAPLTPETKGLLGAPEFSAMKKTAIVMNVGRGPVIDEPALIQALQAGEIAGAALDVFEEEPLPEDSPFYRMENVLMSAHSADHTPDWLDQAMVFFYKNLELFRTGEQLLNVVDKRAGY